MIIGIVGGGDGRLRKALIEMMCQSTNHVERMVEKHDWSQSKG